MKTILNVIIFWFCFIIVLLQIAINKELYRRVEILEIENYNRSVEVDDLKIKIEEYQKQTERIIDTNMKLLTEGGWNGYQNENN